MKLHENEIINYFMLAGNSEEKSIELLDAIHKVCSQIGLSELEMAYKIDAVERGNDIGTASAEQISEAIASCKGFKFMK